MGQIIIIISMLKLVSCKQKHKNYIMLKAV